jgi:hypothetical protein
MQPSQIQPTLPGAKRAAWASVRECHPSAECAGVVRLTYETFASPDRLDRPIGEPHRDVPDAAVRVAGFALVDEQVVLNRHGHPPASGDGERDRRDPVSGDALGIPFGYAQRW